MTAIKKPTKATLREREVYNEAVRDTLKEVWKYDGVIPDRGERKSLVRNVQEDVSYKSPKPKPLILI